MEQLRRHPVKQPEPLLQSPASPASIQNKKTGNRKPNSVRQGKGRGTTPSTRKARQRRKPAKNRPITEYLTKRREKILLGRLSSHGTAEIQPKTGYCSHGRCDELIAQCLHEYSQAPRKQHHTAKRIHDRQKSSFCGKMESHRGICPLEFPPSSAVQVRKDEQKVTINKKALFKSRRLLMISNSKLTEQQRPELSGFLMHILRRGKPIKSSPLF